MAGGVVAAWLLVSGLAAWGVPVLVKRAVSGQVAEMLGRPAAVGEVSFNPFTLVLRARALQVFEADGTTPTATVDSIEVNASIFSLFRLAPILDKIQVTGLHVALVRTDVSRFNISDIVDRLAARPSTDGPTPRFSLNNVTLTGGEITLDDRVTGRKHTLQQLEIGLPFLSTLPYAVDIDVLPKVSALVNGSALSVEGKARPFDTPRSSAIELAFKDLALDAFADAWPAPWQVSVKHALLDADLQLVFEAPPDVAPTLKLSGDMALREVDVRAKPDAALLQFKQLALKQFVLEPLAKRFTVANVTLDGPQLEAVRAANGRINLADIAASFSAPATAASTPATPSAAHTPAGRATAATPASPSPVPASGLAAGDPAIATAAGPSPAATPAVPPSAWQIQVQSASLLDGRIAWRDAPANFSYVLSDVALGIDTLNIPEAAGQSATLRLSARTDKAGKLEVSGPVRLQPLRAELTAQVADLGLTALAPLWKPSLALNVTGGALDLKAKLTAAQADGNWAVSWADGTLALKQFQAASVADPTSKLTLDRLGIDGVSGDLAGRRVQVGQIAVNGLSVDARRDASQRIAWASLTAPASSAAPVADATTVSWAARIARISVDTSSVRWLDEGVSPRVNARLDNLQLQAANVNWPAQSPVDVTLQSDIQRGGKLVLKGSVVPQPLAVQADVTATRVNLTALAPYFAQRLNARLAGLSVGAKGRVDYAAANGRQPQKIAWKGAADITDFDLVDKSNGADFLKWKRLAFSQLDILQQGERLKADLGPIALEDFFARIILRDTGRLNLREILVTPEGGTDAPAEGSITQATGTRAGRGKSEATVPVNPADDANRDIRMGGLKLVRGNINFTDNFVKPNYTANLTDIEGSISALAMRQPEPADVAIKGRVDSNAPLEITGKLQPFGEQLYTDIRASAKGVDLPGLTPYAAKYAGYPIERGKLSMDVHYVIQDGKLTATNKVVLDQLTIGDRLDGPSVFNLPVRLAVSLLKNSRGEINIDLPIAGSLDDPQFSIGGIIFRALGNLILRAVTAPFSLLASAFSGIGNAETLSYVEFEPGSAVLDEAGKKKVDTLAAALTERPALKLDLSGRVDPAVDTDGLRKRGVEVLMVEQKRRVVDRAGQAGGVVQIEPAERSKYLEAAYKAAKFDKPRNMIGFTKSVPDDEMQRMLEASIDVGPAQLRELAVRRAQAAMDVLREAKLDSRAFLVSPHLDASGVKDGGKPTRVDFSLK